MSRRVLISVALAASVALCLVAGFAVGRTSSASKSEAAQVRALAEKRSRQPAYEQARATTMDSARRKAARRARRLGTERGTRAGRRAGQAEAESRRQAEAAKPTTGYFGGCSEPLFVDGYCPTPQEIQAERDIEAYCGPGMKLPDGRIVPKPGC